MELYCMHSSSYLGELLEFVIYDNGDAKFVQNGCNISFRLHVYLFFVTEMTLIHIA